MELIERKGSQALLLVRCDRCVGLIGKGLYDLWYNDIYKFEESLDFLRLIFIKSIGNKYALDSCFIYHPDAGHSGWGSQYDLLQVFTARGGLSTNGCWADFKGWEEAFWG